MDSVEKHVPWDGQAARLDITEGWGIVKSDVCGNADFVMIQQSRNS